MAVLCGFPAGDAVAQAGSIGSSYAYRLSGKIRLLFFWVGSDDVGGARLTLHRDDHGHDFSLLIGTDPTRAPRKMNEWGYVREQVSGSSATLFGIRTMTDGDSPDHADAKRMASELAEFGVLCSAVSPSGMVTHTATVRAPRDFTYRDVARVIDIADSNQAWRRYDVPRPRDAVGGFLTALDVVMRTTVESSRHAGRVATPPPLAYVYKNAVFDLTARRIERVEELHTDAAVLRNLLRAELSIRNRTTGWTGSFYITYGTEGALAGIPVAARYQPNWWFKVEMELQPDQDMPADPASDAIIDRRIAGMCAPAASR